MILQSKRITVLQSLTDNVCPLCLHWRYSSWIHTVFVFFFKSHSFSIKLGQGCPNVSPITKHFIWLLDWGHYTCYPQNPIVPTISRLRVWAQWSVHSFSQTLGNGSKCLIYIPFPREWDHMIYFPNEAPKPPPPLSPILCRGCYFQWLKTDFLSKKDSWWFQGANYHASN